MSLPSRLGSLGIVLVAVACSHAHPAGKTHAVAGAGAGSGAGRAEAKPFDGTALVAPIVITAEEVALPSGGDCTSKQLRFHLKDAKGGDATFVFGTITGMTDGGTPPGPLAAADQAFTDHGTYCAGLRSGYVVKVAGATLVADEDWTDEESGDGKASHVIATLPAGAVTLQ